MKARYIAFALPAMLAAAVSACAAAIPFRGVVEGYYGRPWGTEGRMSLLNFMGENSLNVFIYGPKDDPYHHKKWREPYPEDQMRDFASLLDVAKDNGVSFYWAVHLGGGFDVASESDWKALFSKLELMYAGGFRAFAVFFDDFGSADASGHAAICNRIVSGFLEKRGDCAPLIMCPNVYWGSGSAYQKTLGRELDARVQIMWTGKRICSDIDADEVAKITADFGRPPFIWWNWPVNDYCRSSLLLGRTYGLDSCKLAGIVSNPMENCEASKIALYSFARWCADPDAFDSRKCWQESFSKLYADPKVARAMRVFAECNSDPGPNGHGYRREEGVSFAALVAKANAELGEKGVVSSATAHELGELFKEVHLAAHILKTSLPKERYDLGWEIEGWLDDEMHLIEQGAAALGMMEPSLCAGGGEDSVALLRRIRRVADEDARRHCEKFAAATFEGDRQHVRRPAASAGSLRPLVEKIVTSALSRLYAERFGRKFDAAAGLAAFSTAAELKGLGASRDGKYAGLVRVMEQRNVGPGETFGLTVPVKWRTGYFHALLGTKDAVESGVIEVSRDGTSWQKLATRNNPAAGEMQSRLDPAAGWTHVRYRNASETPVQVKIDLFKFDVEGIASPIDAMLDELGDN